MHIVVVLGLLSFRPLRNLSEMDRKSSQKEEPPQDAGEILVSQKREFPRFLKGIFDRSLSFWKTL
jgi:hypothetical protein